MKRFLACVFLAAAPLLAAASPPLSEPLTLVARPELRDPVYGSTVIAVTPIPAARHIGFILNRPTRTTLAELFPEHAPSREVEDPVYYGGPISVGAVFALVAQPDNPGGASLRVGPGVFATLDAPTTDAVIESSAESARFVTGFVVWRPGELAYEIERGAWYVRNPDAALVLSDPVGLWREQVRRALYEASLLGAAYAR